MDADEYIKDRLDNQINWYDRKSASNKRFFLTLRWIEIVAAAIIPFLAGMTQPDENLAMWAIGILGVIIAVCAATTSLLQFQEHWIEYRTTAESLKKERYLFLTKVEPYDGEDAFTTLVQRVETSFQRKTQIGLNT